MTALSSQMALWLMRIRIAEGRAARGDDRALRDREVPLRTRRALLRRGLVWLTASARNPSVRSTKAGREAFKGGVA